MATTSLKATIRRLLAKFKGAPALNSEDEGVKNFRECQQKEAAFDSRVRGIRCVRLAQIVGSVGRYQDFDSHFRLKHAKPSERLQAIKEAMRSGQPLPPVKLYQIKDRYFVLDGNHRIAAAKEFGWRDIDANIL